MSRRCAEVSAFCPVEATVLGYYPNLGVNAFLAAGFGACLIGLVVTGVWKKTWGYSAALTAGCILEFVGYVARVQLHTNPWNSSAFQTQICAIILAPTLLCIAVYLTLKHAASSVAPAVSRVPPRLYPLVFVPADVSCLVLQAIGGGLAASAGADDPHLLLVGDRVIIAGIALQCAVLAFFGLVSGDYLVRAARAVARGQVGDDARALWFDRRFRAFGCAVAGAYAGILIRCIYRIAEMAGGWGNPIMQDEPSFIVLEGFMILIPVVLLTAFPPGFLFPAMAEREAQRFRRTKTKTDTETAAGVHEKRTEEPVASSGDEGKAVEPLGV
ncbi:RTA1-domain-containing protein [Xylariaceae sp. FL0662B]|nr:RTA1-domain-containing protein [Xylariaceae sp. FL0662B]